MKNKIIKFFIISLVVVVVVSTFVISSSAASSRLFTLSGSTDFIVPFGSETSVAQNYTFNSYDLPFGFYYYDILTYYYENMGQYLKDSFDINHYDYIPVVLFSDTNYSETEFGYFYSDDYSNNIDLFNSWNLEHEFIAVTVLDVQAVDDAVPWGTPVHITGNDVALDHSRYSLFLLPLSSQFVQNSPYIDVLERATYNQFNDSLYGLTYRSIGEFMFEDLNELSSIQELTLHLLCAVVWIVLLAIPVVLVYFLLKLIC